MSVHCFKAVGSPEITENKANQRVEDHLFSNFNDVLPSQHSLKINSTLDKSEYLAGIIRFELNESKQDIIDKIETEVVHDLSWYRIRYHECNHDNPDEEEGTWSTLSEHGTIPDYV